MIARVISYALALAFIGYSIYACTETMTAPRNWIYYGKPEGM